MANMHPLIFDLEAVLAQIAHAKGSTKHRQTFSENLDGTAATAALHLVGDQGVYLMSNGIDTDNPRQGVVFAKGIDPEKDEEWYLVKRSACGGDDFVDRLPDEWTDYVAEEGPAVLERARKSGFKGAAVVIEMSVDNMAFAGLKPLA